MNLHDDMATGPDASDPASGRHPVNVTHLVFGVIFASCVGAWALVAAGAVSTFGNWLLPLPWLLAGLSGLLALALGGRSRTGSGAAEAGAGSADSSPLP